MNRYDRSAIRFHWVSAALILMLWPIGKIMVSSGSPSSILYSVHVGLGLVVAAVTVGRVVWVWRGTRPEALDMPRGERILFVANHYLLYALLLALSLSGIAMLVAAGSFDATALAKNDGPSSQHEFASTVFLVMFAMHVVGVVLYQIKKGKTLRRMGVPIGD